MGDTTTAACYTEPIILLMIPAFYSHHKMLGTKMKKQLKKQLNLLFLILHQIYSVEETHKYYLVDKE